MLFIKVLFLCVYLCVFKEEMSLVNRILISISKKEKKTLYER